MFGGGGVVAEFFPLTAVTDPKFVLFKHVLCFARIMSTLCPNVGPMSTNCPTPYRCKSSEITMARDTYNVINTLWVLILACTCLYA